MNPDVFEWLRIGAQLLGALLGVLGALYLYERRVRREARERKRVQRDQILVQLSTEIATNKRTIGESLNRNLALAAKSGSGNSPEETVDDERLVYLAPLFGDSFSAIVANDLQQHVDANTLNHLYDYYAKVARANWLIQRVQSFRYRPSIISEISDSLTAIQKLQDEVLTLLEDVRRKGGDR